jgi:hypothetical protein
MIVFCFFAALFPDFLSHSNPQYNSTQLSNMGFYDNERYLLSALVQSLAATIALVITLSLVAVQLAAQSYSAKVIDVYKKNPDMWILLGIYIFTIFYGLGLIKIVELDVSGINMEGAIFVAYFMGFFAFVSLVPYMLKTLDLLKPSTVIKLLAAEITKEKVLEFLEKGDDIDENDPLQPIVDMTNSALARNDYETAKNGINSITKSAIFIIQLVDIGNEKRLHLAQYHIMTHIERLGNEAINKQNEDSVLSIIINLEKIGNEAAKRNQIITLFAAVMSLEKIGTKAIENNLNVAALLATTKLGKLWDHATDLKLNEIAEITALNIRKLSDKASELKNELITNKANEILKEIGTKTKSNSLNRIVENEVSTVLKKIEEYEELNNRKDTKDT